VPKAQGLVGRIGKALGDASYSIYLVHTAAISGMLGLLARKMPNAPDAVIVLANIGIALLAGLAAHYLIEVRVVAFAQKIILGRARRNAASLNSGSTNRMR
jgi:peptidoglycan/LPS O-acetylase OafA/YrhL